MLSVAAKILRFILFLDSKEIKNDEQIYSVK